MTCHHRAGDPACGSYAREAARRESEHAANRETALREVRAEMTPDNTKYEIVDVEQVGPHLVLKVVYPNCVRCSFEGNKVMVFLNMTAAQALKWKVIDPHFRDGPSGDSARNAPCPRVRFPADAKGWSDALAWARFKAEKHQLLDLEDV